jgi:hypothetical protein
MRLMEESTARESSVESQIHDLLDGGSDETLAAMVTQYTKVCEEISKQEKVKEAFKGQIMAKLNEIGSTSMKIAGRRIGITERTYYGLDKEKLAEAKAWMEANAPEYNVPASSGVGKAVEAWLADHPGQPIPPFVTSSITRILTNAKA